MPQRSTCHRVPAANQGDGDNTALYAGIGGGVAAVLIIFAAFWMTRSGSKLPSERNTVAFSNPMYADAANPDGGDSPPAGIVWAQDPAPGEEDADIITVTISVNPTPPPVGDDDGDGSGDASDGSSDEGDDS